MKWCRGPDLNRYGSHLPQDFKSCASANSATPAHEENGADDEARTRDPNLGKVVLYQLSYIRKFMAIEIKWLGWLDSNQRMTESKSVALPLGYTPI